MSSKFLSLENLSKTFPDGTKALRGVSFEVQPGEFIAIVGSSGSGKSTLLRCLNRMINPTQGKITYRGRAVETAKGSDLRDLRKKMAMIFQQFNLISRYSVQKNVLLGRLANHSTWQSILGKWTKNDLADAQKFLDLVGIREKSFGKAQDLSGGQQQRVAIARALMQSPEVLLADEPVASLDPVTARTVMNYLKKINQELGITVLCSLHSLDLVKEYSTRVIALRDGQVAFSGSPDQLTPSWYADVYEESEGHNDL